MRAPARRCQIRPEWGRNVGLRYQCSECLRGCWTKGSGCDANPIAMFVECEAGTCPIKEKTHRRKISFLSYSTSPPAMKSVSLLSSFVASALFFSRSLAVTLTDASQLTTTTYDYVIVGGMHFSVVSGLCLIGNSWECWACPC